VSARNGRDPIFALIEKHTLAIKASDKATQSLARLQARIDARPLEKRKHESRRLTCAVPFFDLGGSKWDPAAVVKSRAEIKTHVFRVFDNAAHGLGRRAQSRVRAHEREAIAELLRRYDAFQRAHSARRRAVGLTARQEAAWKAQRTCSDALSALANAKAATPEGQAALAQYMASLRPAQAPWWAMRAVLEGIGWESHGQSFGGARQDRENTQCPLVAGVGIKSNCP
jgi:hypothetical protein